MVKSVTVPGKCYAKSDGDRQDDPFLNPAQLVEVVTKCSVVSVPSADLAAKSSKYWCSLVPRHF